MWHLQDFVGHRPLVSKLLGRATGGVRVAVAASEAVADDARRTLPRLPVRVVHNVTDVEHFAPGTPEGGPGWLDARGGLDATDADVVRVVLIATYARWKGQDIFLEAAARVIRQRRDVRFFIVGGPIYRTAGTQFSEGELRAKAAALGLERCVGFVPFQEDPLDVYRAADVVVHASTLPEPFGLTVIEAMACARATIVSRAGGAAELFTDGEDALAFVPGDVAGLAAALLRLCGDASTRARLGAAARGAVVRRFNSNGLPEQVRDVYGGLI